MVDQCFDPCSGMPGDPPPGDPLRYYRAPDPNKPSYDGNLEVTCLSRLCWHQHTRDCLPFLTAGMPFQVLDAYYLGTGIVACRPPCAACAAHNNTGNEEAHANSAATTRTGGTPVAKDQDTSIEVSALSSIQLLRNPNSIGSNNGYTLEEGGNSS